MHSFKAKTSQSADEGAWGQCGLLPPECVRYEPERMCSGPPDREESADPGSSRGRPQSAPACAPGTGPLWEGPAPPPSRWWVRGPCTATVQVMSETALHPHRPGGESVTVPGDEWEGPAPSPSRWRLSFSPAASQRRSVTLQARVCFGHVPPLPSVRPRHTGHTCCPSPVTHTDSSTPERASSPSLWFQCALPQNQRPSQRPGVKCPSFPCLQYQVRSSNRDQVPFFYDSLSNVSPSQVFSFYSEASFWNVCVWVLFLIISSPSGRHLREVSRSGPAFWAFWRLYLGCQQCWLTQWRGRLRTALAFQADSWTRRGNLLRKPEEARPLCTVIAGCSRGNPFYLPTETPVSNNTVRQVCQPLNYGWAKTALEQGTC